MSVSGCSVLLEAGVTVDAVNRPEVWGGIECTVNRVGGHYFDQLHSTGHHDREEDLDRIAELQIRVLRYPVIWERVEHAPGIFDWTWTDRRLLRLRDLGIEPIATLLHHGSGPRWTSLIDENFSTGLARFAARVAARYPWLKRYTVVNEPLTTARFSALYGLWFPHLQSDRAFVKAMIQQCRGTVLAMRAIRAVNSEAELLQTEDVCIVHAGDNASQKAHFYNARRWLTFDLLSGHVGARHPLWKYLITSGFTRQDAGFFARSTTHPHTFGLNYYVTSDRYLEDRPLVSANETSRGESFVDIEAVRGPYGLAGHLPHIREAWERYRRPLAITEVHLGCTREEQLRWLQEAWQSACCARSEGIPLVAITPWALVGSSDWSSLVTRANGDYESGAFDGRAGCRPTALAGAIRELAGGAASLSHPASRGPGWWRRAHALPTPVPPDSRQPLLIAGGNGTLGKAFVRVCGARGLSCRAVSRFEMDVTNLAAVNGMVANVRPWAIVNASGYVRVDAAERERDLCWRINVQGPATLANAAARAGIPLLTFSSDLVFDGRQDHPYTEDDPVSPLSVYGSSKAASEMIVLDRWARTLVVRTAAFFGPWDPDNFVTRTIEAFLAGESSIAADDEIISPTYVPDLASASLDLLIDDCRGVWHLTNEGALSWTDFGRAAARACGLDPDRLDLRARTVQDTVAVRPRFSALTSRRGNPMPTLQSALERYAHERPDHPYRRAHGVSQAVRDGAFVTR
jgi:dTDP-4-dehydrorhamnose reductase